MWRMDSVLALVLWSSNEVERKAAQRQGRLSLTKTVYGKPFVWTLQRFYRIKEDHLSQVPCKKSSNISCVRGHPGQQSTTTQRPSNYIEHSHFSLAETF
jgi:hypothetical protein